MHSYESNSCYMLEKYMLKYYNEFNYNKKKTMARRHDRNHETHYLGSLKLVHSL